MRDRTPEGKTDHVKLDVIWEDNAYNVPKTISIYKRQKAAGAMVMGVTGSTPSEAASLMGSRDEVPIFSIYGPAAPTTMALKPRYTTASVGNHAEQPAAILKWVRDIWTEGRAPRVGILSIDIPTTRPMADPQGVPAYASELGVDWLDIEWIAMGVTDTTIELTRLMNKNPDWIIAWHVIGGVTVIMKDAFRMGLKDKVNFVAPAWGYDESLIRLAPEAVEGLYGGLNTALPSEDVPGVKLGREIISKYLGEELNLMHILGVTFAMEAAEGLRIALEQTGYEGLTRSAINYGLQHITDFDTGGLTPQITVDPDYPVLIPYVRRGIIEGGKVKAASDWYPYPALLR